MKILHFFKYWLLRSLTHSSLRKYLIQKINYNWVKSCELVKHLWTVTSPIWLFLKVGYVRNEISRSTASCDLWFRIHEVMKFRPRRLLSFFGIPLKIHISVNFRAIAKNFSFGKPSHVEVSCASRYFHTTWPVNKISAKSEMWPSKRVSLHMISPNYITQFKFYLSLDPLLILTSTPFKWRKKIMIRLQFIVSFRFTCFLPIW